MTAMIDFTKFNSRFLTEDGKALYPLSGERCKTIKELSFRNYCIEACELGLDIETAVRFAFLSKQHELFPRDYIKSLTKSVRLPTDPEETLEEEATTVFCFKQGIDDPEDLNDRQRAYIKGHVQSILHPEGERRERVVEGETVFRTSTSSKKGSSGKKRTGRPMRTVEQINEARRLKVAYDKEYQRKKKERLAKEAEEAREAEKARETTSNIMTQ